MIRNQEYRYEKIKELQKEGEKIRNVSIIAHVDHGKTTLCDSLLSTNHIISKGLIGKLRYMDSRKDEQQRMITMKSSAISLYFQSHQDYLINLIDSPGHVEFSCEVQTALMLTDGALILVDVLEGISSQTYTVIKQAYTNKVKMVLILNKVDRLINELMMDLNDIYIQLK